MMLGKIIGGVIGWATLGPAGALLGVAVGHFFDKGRAQIANRFDPNKKHLIEQAFFHALYPLLGKLAKADGRISEEEVQATEQLIEKMALNASQREEAIALFKKGAQEEFDAVTCINAFMDECGQYGDLKQILLVYLITLAYADGHLHNEEEKILAELAGLLGHSKFTFNRLMGMIKAQTHFYRGQQEQSGYHQYYQGRSGHYDTSSSKNDIQTAYEALGVESSVTDAELKKAYRKLMSEYHPDKLQGRGVPEDMVKMATEKSQEIQTAYELLKTYRKKT